MKILTCWYLNVFLGILRRTGTYVGLEAIVFPCFSVLKPNFKCNFYSILTLLFVENITNRMYLEEA